MVCLLPNTVLRFLLLLYWNSCYEKGGDVNSMYLNRTETEKREIQIFVKIQSSVVYIKLKITH